MKVFETFAGIGAQHKALSNLKNNFEIVGISEWNIYSIIAYAIIHYNNEFYNFVLPKDHEIDEYLKNYTFSIDGKNPLQYEKLIKNKLKYDLYKANILTKNFGNITKINGLNIPDIDLLTYSFPCTDISLAGKRKGMAKNTNTSSSLLWEIERILTEMPIKPKFLLMENVSAINNKTNKPHFNVWIDFLSSLGYKSKIYILNCKDFSIPQNRERVFLLSTLDNNFIFEDFVKQEKDSLENFLQIESLEYNENYTNKLIKYISEKNDYRFVQSKNGLNYLLTEKLNKYNASNRFILLSGISCTVDCNTDKKNKFLISRCIPTLTSKPGGSLTKLLYNDKNSFSTINENDKNIISLNNLKVYFIDNLNSFLLQGFDVEDYEKIKTLPKGEIRKMIGNSIPVNLLELIFASMYKNIA